MMIIKIITIFVIKKSGSDNINDVYYNNKTMMIVIIVIK
jgi:hypothetical protein